jgi:hypothetical protein
MPKKWTPEMLEKARKTREENARKAKTGPGPVSQGAMIAYTKHMAEDVLRDIVAGVTTIKTVRRRDALALLAFTEITGRV